MSVKEANSWLRRLGRAGRVSEAAEVFAAQAQRGVPAVSLWTSLLAAYAHQGDVRATEQLWQAMRAAGCPPSLRSHTARLSAHSRAGDLAGALTALRDVALAGHTPDTPMWTALLRACHGDRALGPVGPQRMWRLYHALRHERLLEPDPVTYALLVSGCARLGEVELALKLVSELEEAKMQPTEVTYNALLQACASRQDYYETTWQVWQRMQNAGFHPDTYTWQALLTAAQRRGDVERCHELTKRVAATGSADRQSATAAVVAYAQRFRHDPAAASKLLPTALRVAEETRVTFGGDSALANATLSVLTEALRVRRAEEFLEQFPSWDAQPDTYTLRHMLRMYARTRRLTKALSLWDDMRKSGVPVNSSHYRWLLLACAKTGEINTGFQFLREMIDAGIQPTEVMVRPFLERCRSQAPERVDEIMRMCGWANFKDKFKVIKKPSEFRTYPEDDEDA